MNWTAIDDRMPAVKQTVLLHWAVPDMPPIYRLGSLLMVLYPDDAAIWKFELDCGDASATIYTNRGDEQPTHWAELIAPAQGMPPVGPRREGGSDASASASPVPQECAQIIDLKGQPND